MKIIQSLKITRNKLLSRKFSCVNKISGYKYIQILQFNEQIKGKYIAKTQRNRGTDEKRN